MYFLIMWIKIRYLHAAMLISLVECGTLFALWDNINIKLCDFGTALDFDDLYTNSLQTVFYRAPEIILNHKYNEKEVKCQKKNHKLL